MDRTTGKRILGILFFSVGILICTALTTAITWVFLESDFYGFPRLAVDRFDGISCPYFMTRRETSTILVSVSNPTEKVIEPVLRVDISTPGVADSSQVQMKIQPGQTQKFERPVGAENIDLGFFIFAKTYRYPTYPLPGAEANCGILILDVPFLTGMQIFIIGLILGLTFTSLGLALWSSNLENAPKAINAAKALTIIALIGLLVSLQGIWIAGLFLIALTILMTTAILRLGTQK